MRRYTPMETGTKLETDMGSEEVREIEGISYRSVIGSIMYTMVNHCKSEQRDQVCDPHSNSGEADSHRSELQGLSPVQ
ncbi:hypothetical protein HDU67_007036 [Dinochytrium kinnereticum]|nr:hypothetical protein HDU67_007036 [Dinochytrium kinnereticum]